MSVFNLATALANLKKKENWVLYYEQARSLVFQLAKNMRGPTMEESILLKEQFNAADIYISQQSKETLIQANQYIVASGGCKAL